MSEARFEGKPAPVSSASWLGDPFDNPEDGVWIRADNGMTRGQAQATIAAEVGCDFTDIRMSVAWLRPYPQGGESEPGVPRMLACKRGDTGALRYWCGRYVR